jgi:hypothetical protein
MAVLEGGTEIVRAICMTLLSGAPMQLRGQRQIFVAPAPRFTQGG